MLGISYSTVNNHLQAAIQLLEVGGRKEAARLYSQTLENPAGQRVPSEPADLAARTLRSIIGLLRGTGGGAGSACFSLRSEELKMHSRLPAPS